MPKATPYESIDLAADDATDEIMLPDGTSVRDLVEWIMREPDAWRRPGLDKVDTVVVLIAALAPLIEASPRYSAHIEVMRRDEARVSDLHTLALREVERHELWPLTVTLH